jgi:hypothetical protein
VEEYGLLCLGGHLRTWRVGPHSDEAAYTQCPQAIADALDAVTTLGGDGTLLWACRAMGGAPIPPILPFAMGSLGFLTPFSANSMPHVLQVCFSRYLLEFLSPSRCSWGPCGREVPNPTIVGTGFQGIGASNGVLTRGLPPYRLPLWAYHAAVAVDTRYTVLHDSKNGGLCLDSCLG